MTSREPTREDRQNSTYQLRVELKRGTMATFFGSEEASEAIGALETSLRFARVLGTEAPIHVYRHGLPVNTLERWEQLYTEAMRQEGLLEVPSGSRPGASPEFYRSFFG